jgi:phospholipase C
MSIKDMESPPAPHVQRLRRSIAVSWISNRNFLNSLFVVAFLSASIGAALGQTPTVASISPTSGAAAGGTSVTITGTNFASGASVTFGTAAATNVTVVNSTTITATTPASAPGAANVTVTNSNEQSGTLWAVQQPLTNPGFEGNPAGTGWTVSGSGTATVLSGSGAHSGSDYAQLTVSSPNTQVSYIATLSGTSAYLPVNPGDVITYGGWAYRVDTNSGDGLARWQIELTNSSQKSPTYQAASPNNVTTAAWVQQQNTYTVPATGVSYVRFWCQITSNTSAKAQANFDDAVLTRTVPGGGYTYVGAPSLTAVSPSNGVTTGGTAVTLTGSNFQTGATVTFGSSAATNVTVVNSTTITATTPSGSSGAVSVTVTNPGGQDAVLSGGFTYSDPAPTASSISPSSGPAGGGTAVTITGTNFLAGATVSFGGIPATGVAVSANGTTITATTPADPSGGVVNVVITNPDSQTTTLWAIQQPLTNPGFESGASGWTAGGFGTVAVINNPAQAHSGNDYAQLTVASPNTQVDYIAQLDGSSEYLPVNPGDVITYGGWAYRVDTNSGDGLARWQIELSGSAKTSYQASSPNNVTTASWVQQQNTYTVPATGVSNVRFWCQITNTSGNVTAQANFDDAFFTRTVPGGGFTYTFPAPTVLSISPTSGTAGSATATTITGTNFVPGATVSFGGIAATNVTVVSATTITATTGTTNPAGPANVVVTNPGGQSGMLANGFTFMGPAPTVTYIAPVGGTVNGGTSINLHGTNFLTGATVTIGGAAVTVTSVGSTLIQGTTTGHIAGGADVVVTNPDTQVAKLSSTLYNQGFESGSTRWVYSGNGTGNIVNCSSSGCGTINNAHSGTYYAELSAAASGHPIYTVANNSGTIMYFPVQPGQVVTFGGWAYRVSGNGSARWTIAVSDVNHANAVYVAAAPGNIWDSQWEQQQGTYTIPAGKAYIQLYCEINAPTQASVARFDDAILQIAPGSATSPVTYTYGYTFNSLPWVNSIAPNWGAPAGGTTRTVWGTGFQTGSTVTVGGAAATNVVVNSANAITFFVPPGNAGSSNVVVTGPDLQPSAQTIAYTYQAPPAPPAGWTAIHHIIYTLQENRSFDQYFGQMNNYYTNIGVTGSPVNVTPSGTETKDIAGVEIPPFHSQTECAENTQPSWNAQHIDYDNGAMDAFQLTGNMFSTSSTIDPNGTRAVGYYDWTDLPFYYSLAYQFATSDTWYSSVMANTGANRSFVVAGTSLGSVGTPTPPAGGLPNMTIFDLLDQAGITWRYYYQDSTPIWIPTWSIYNKNVGPMGFNANIVPISNYATDVQDESTFPQVVFIEENGGMDEHPKPNPGASGATGSVQLGANLTSGFIEDLLKSPTWSSSVLVFTYDEAGGLYDHVSPPANEPIPDGYPPQVNPGTDQPGLFNQFGMRVPVMVVSPWTAPHYVSHVTHDHTSILKFIETRFSLPPLTSRDAAADDLADFFGTSGVNLTNGTTPWLTPPTVSTTCSPGTTACLVTQPTTGACNLNLEAAPGQ